MVRLIVSGPIDPATPKIEKPVMFACVSSPSAEDPDGLPLPHPINNKCKMIIRNIRKAMCIIASPS
jgi:hypothetical protein